MKHSTAILSIISVMCLLTAGCGLALSTDDSDAANSTTNITVAQGQAWTYTFTTNLANPTYSISGSATAWVTLSGNTVSGTVPSTSSANTTLVITAATTKPTQTATQTINFTITDGISFRLGENVNGVLNLNTGNLAISGTGAMYSWLDTDDSPILPYHTNIRTIDIGENVTTIGANFGNDGLGGEGAILSNLQSVTGGEGLTSIGANAFAYCGYNNGNGMTVEWSAFESLTTIQDAAFEEAYLSTIILPNTVQTLANDVFKNVNWTYLMIGNGLQNITVTSFGNVAFTQFDNTAINIYAIGGNLYHRENSTSGKSMLEHTAKNGYNETITYLVAGKTMPNSAQDNLNIEISVDATALPTAIVDFLEATLTSSCTLSTAIGSGVITIGTNWTEEDGVYTAGASFTSGTAPSTAGTISSNANIGMTYTNGASVTLNWTASFTAITVDELVFTSSP